MSQNCCQLLTDTGISFVVSSLQSSIATFKIPERLTVSRSDNQGQRVMKIWGVNVILPHSKVSSSSEMILNVRFVTILTMMRNFALEDSELIVLKRTFLVKCRRILWISNSYRPYQSWGAYIYGTMVYRRRYSAYHVAQSMWWDEVRGSSKVSSLTWPPISHAPQLCRAVPRWSFLYWKTTHML